MTYISIDTSSVQGKKLVALIKTMPFAKILQEPNSITKKAMDDAKRGKVKNYKSSNDLIALLNK